MQVSKKQYNHRQELLVCNIFSTLIPLAVKTIEKSLVVIAVQWLQPQWSVLPVA